MNSLDLNHLAAWCLAQLDLVCGDHLLQRAELLQCIATYRRIDFNDCYSFTTALASAQMKPANVHSTIAKNRSDTSNHARHITIPRYQHVTMWYRLKMKTIYLRDSSFSCLTAITEQCAGQTLCQTTCMDLRSDCSC